MGKGFRFLSQRTEPVPKLHLPGRKAYLWGTPCAPHLLALPQHPTATLLPHLSPHSRNVLGTESLTSPYCSFHFQIKPLPTVPSTFKLKLTVPSRKLISPRGTQWKIISQIKAHCSMRKLTLALWGTLALLKSNIPNQNQSSVTFSAQVRKEKLQTVKGELFRGVNHHFM